MVNFRSNFRDLAGWAEYGIPLTTTSNQAVKMYDAALDQMVYYYNDPQLGGAGDCIRRMLAEDPDFIAGNLLELSLELFITNSRRSRAKFDKYCSGLNFDSLHNYEKMHIEAAKFLYAEDIVGAMKQYAAISKRYPYDIHSFNLGFILGLITGHTTYMRDIPLAIVGEYKPHMPHYGLIHGKLCFGHSENAEYDSAKRCGEIALEAFPLDSWAVHAVAHMHENQSNPKQGIAFIEDTMKYWSRGVNFSQHIHWHNANAYIQLEDYETALSIYDQHIVPCTTDGDLFPLSDASSLLMRLQIDGQDIGNRHARLAPLWSTNNDDFTSFFYDGHSSFAAAMAGDTASLDVLLENLHKYIASDRGGWNKAVTTEHGLHFVEGMKLMMEGDYVGATAKLQTSVPVLVKVMHGSKAQKSIFSLIFVCCALKSGVEEQLVAAEEHLEELMRWNNATKMPPLQQRLWNKIQREHKKH